LVSRPVLRVRVQPVRTETAVDQSVIVTLNGAPIARAPLDGDVSLSATLTQPLHRAAPNVIVIEHDYRRALAARGPEHRIGTTGRTSPVDLVVRSGGQPHGDVASIRIGVGEVASNQRGYNLVALGPDGDLRARVAFDTLADPGASGRLAAWVEALPAETIVVGAVKDEASERLGADAIRAFAMLGVRGDLRGRYRESHAFVGVKGAPPGSAVEALGPRAVEIRVGAPAAGFGIELVEFALEPPAAAR
ncbi:MAG TPA: interleukin-like EMT inducer domain-containing protein, partial [Pseudonocardia sp.]|nr:interleukin-like EMT inducer domain-containing protein [Pseudonocardia sp.]